MQAIFESGSSNTPSCWELLQNAMRKKVGKTRDLLEFAIKVRSIFDGFDDDGSGQISAEELRKALRSLGVNVSVKEMNLLMKRFDHNGDQCIDFQEFEDMVKELIPPPEFDVGGIFLEQKLKASFEKMDLNGDKTLDAEEIRLGLQELGIDMSEEHLKRVMAVADTSGDGTVDYDEFVQLYSKYPVKIQSEEELLQISRKWEPPEIPVRDCRPPWKDDTCKPGARVMLMASCRRLPGYHRYQGVGVLTRPVEGQPGRWFVRFPGVSEVFMNVGKNGIYELSHIHSDLAKEGAKKENEHLEEFDSDLEEERDLDEEDDMEGFRTRLKLARLSALELENL
uniref:EF-hand domain-containing protein n=1 Tax=Guillardia theta TaxID=55529 RepID=A0A7S4L8K0_GUITH|mmetsp:Transcript_39064/g.123186  ORF Transcript_39064/g.123186 Transcript_39064/m.123186 type:complete len:338 (+) Transcript_39064:451-1464(+)